ncbi:MAG: excinuclease ABC subunit UvrB [Armatimonadetes bacterium]|nr:excinuclease ABC subunit UvrB [Armatimonadota bacterium]
MPGFELRSDYTLQGDQPQAVERLVEGIGASHRFQTLLGATGTGKTFTVAHVIQRVQRPALIIAHNKTLAAQLCGEFRDFFPDNAVEYFVSYYDYYQPEAYIPQTDTYIEKDAQINDEIDRLRHSATQAVLERRDVIVVASVSCIYGLGSPEEYSRIICNLRVGQVIRREDVLHRLVDMQFTRNNLELQRGTFRVRGDVLEIQPIDEEIIVRAEFFGDEIERISIVNPVTGEIVGRHDEVTVFPASHFVTSAERMERALALIEEEMRERVDTFNAAGKLLEAQRIEQRTKYDLEMMRELGYCSGIENYSRFMDGREPGTPPFTLLDFFPDDFVVYVDESHQTIPQLRGMYAGDMARKETLVEFGFRLPSAKDNRPLKFPEWLERVKQVVFVSATPADFERTNSAQVVEQIIRPTGLVDPEIVVRPTKGQIDDLIHEIRLRSERKERVLVTTLTRRMAEDLSAYLEELGVKVNYLHFGVKTLDRAEVLRDLRLGIHDVVIGVNLLREGLDLPEVTLVAILDADKEGFLRSETSLVQTVGRAARNVSGQVIMYADHVTGSMQRAIDETNRRRAIQVRYNEDHDITPQTVQKAVRDLIAAEHVAEQRTTYRSRRNLVDAESMPLDQIHELIGQLEATMKEAARALEFERAAEIRDEITEFRKFAPADQASVPSKQPRRSARP